MKIVQEKISASGQYRLIDIDLSGVTSLTSGLALELLDEFHSADWLFGTMTPFNNKVRIIYTKKVV